MSMSFLSSEASTMFRSSTASSTSESVISRSHCKILDRELNYMKTKYSHFEIEHELSEERILMPYVTTFSTTYLETFLLSTLVPFSTCLPFTVLP